MRNVELNARNAAIRLYRNRGKEATEREIRRLERKLITSTRGYDIEKLRNLLLFIELGGIL